MATVKQLMALTKDAGFRNRVKFALFDEAKDRAGGGPSGPDLDYINGILNGEAPFDNVVTAVVVENADAVIADDVSLKASVNTLWSFLAAAWVARTV